MRLAWLGARLSGASASNWSRAPAACRALLGLFDLIYAHDLETREFLEAHGAQVTGQLEHIRACHRVQGTCSTESHSRPWDAATATASE